MSYSSPAAPTTQADLMSKVSTFAVATMGWTEDLYDGANKVMSLHKGTCYAHFFWDDNNVVDPVSIAMYQSLGYLGAPPGTWPWEHTDDSGFGEPDDTSPDLGNERGIKYIGPGPYTALHLFGSTSPDPDVIYGVLEYAPGLYRHFAFGNVEKYGTWTGGEFVAGHHWDRGAPMDAPNSTLHSVLMDGIYTNSGTIQANVRAGATIHCEGFPNQDAAGKWGAAGLPFYMATPANLTDRAGEDMVKIYGGVRGGPALLQLGWQQPDIAKGYIPIIPIELYYADLSATPDNYHFLGRLANIGHIQLTGIDPNTTITIGADTWRAFPAVRKSKVGGDVEESWDMGLIYKQ